MKGLERALYEGYRSTSEKIIAKIFEKYGINFDYERKLLVEEEGSKEKVIHPDFYLTDYGIILEFVGMPDNKDYMKVIEWKTNIYEQMGYKVLYVYLDEMWEKTEGGYKVKEEFEGNLIEKINGEIQIGYADHFRRFDFYPVIEHNQKSYRSNERISS
jgi:hypothetical protein